MYTLGVSSLILICVARFVWPLCEAVVGLLVEDVEQYSVTFNNSAVTCRAVIFAVEMQTT